MVDFKEIEVLYDIIPNRNASKHVVHKTIIPSNTQEVVQQVQEIINSHSLSLTQEVILKVNLEVVLIAIISAGNPPRDFCLDLCKVEKNTWPILVNPKPHCRLPPI